MKAYEERQKCFVEQYNGFTVPVRVNGKDSRAHVNGAKSLGENIADAGGVLTAYRAWKKRESLYPSPLLPKLKDHWTKDQLFFLAYASTWCGKSRPEQMYKQLQADVHPPHESRILVCCLRGTLEKPTDRTIRVSPKIPRISRKHSSAPIVMGPPRRFARCGSKLPTQNQMYYPKCRPFRGWP